MFSAYNVMLNASSSSFIITMVPHTTALLSARFGKGRPPGGAISCPLLYRTLFPLPFPLNFRPQVTEAMLAPREIQRATDEVIFEEYAFQAAVVAPPPVLAVRAPSETR